MNVVCTHLNFPWLCQNGVKWLWCKWESGPWSVAVLTVSPAQSCSGRTFSSHQNLPVWERATAEGCSGGGDDDIEGGVFCFFLMKYTTEVKLRSSPQSRHYLFLTYKGRTGNFSCRTVFFFCKLSLQAEICQRDVPEYRLTGFHLSLCQMAPHTHTKTQKENMENSWQKGDIQNSIISSRQD